MSYQVTLQFDTVDPLEDRSELRRLYWEEGLSLREIAERYDYHHTTVRKRMIEYGIDLRDGGGAPKTVEHAALCQHTAGYEMWVSDHDVALVHRLVAVAEYGFDTVRENHIHHENEITWDNRPANLTPLTPSQHGRRHAR